MFRRVPLRHVEFRGGIKTPTASTRRSRCDQRVDSPACRDLFPARARRRQMNTYQIRKRTAGRFHVSALGLIIGLLVTASAFAQPLVSDPVYPAGFDAPMLVRLVDGHLADARAAVERLVAVRGPRTAANTL